MIIYKITNKLNGKIYIGQTTQKLSDRWSDHTRPCSGYHKNNLVVALAIRKYGKENFIVEQIDEAASLEELNIKEITYIKALNCLSPNGYNLELGGDSKFCHSETKVKISEKLKGRSILHRYKGGNRAPRTKAQKEHLSLLNKGKPNVALYKQVECSNGNVYESVNAAASAAGVDRVTVSNLLKSGKVGRNGLTYKFKK